MGGFDRALLAPSEFALRKAIKGAILVAKPLESGECRLNRDWQPRRKLLSGRNTMCSFFIGSEYRLSQANKTKHRRVPSLSTPFLLMASLLLLAPRGLSAAQNYVFRLNDLKLFGTVSPSSDTDWAMFTVKVGDQTLGPIMKKLGDLHGTPNVGHLYQVDLQLGPASVPDDTEVLMTYQIINNGHSNDPGPVIQKAGDYIKALGPLGTAIDPAVGAVVVGVGTLAWATKGSFIRRDSGPKSFSTIVKSYDVGGPSGLNVCNGHVRYDLSFSILPSYVRIDSVNSGLSMDVVAGSQDNGAPIQQYTTHNGPDQRWNLFPTAGIDKPTFASVVSVNSGKALDVPNGSHDAGTLIQQYDFHGGPNQRWNFIPAANGQSVQLQNDASGLVLDVINGSTAPGAGIQQYSSHGGPNQQWRIVADPVEP
jgi:hypothetical protein